MANTNLLKTLAEPYVRRWLSSKYDIDFYDYEKELRLITGGVHRFDIVSKDGSIIAGIKTSALRDNGRVGTGVIKSTFTELYFLSLTKAKTKLMILTDKGYYEYFRKVSKGKVDRGIEIIFCYLPKSIKDKIKEVHKTCSEEIKNGMSRKKGKNS